MRNILPIEKQKQQSDITHRFDLIGPEKAKFLRIMFKRCHLKENTGSLKKNSGANTVPTIKNNHRTLKQYT